MKKLINLTLFILTLSSIQLCSSTSLIKKKDISNLDSVHGSSVSYLTASNIALYWFGVFPILHRAELKDTLGDFAKEAKAKKAKKIRVIQKDVTRWYIVYPPFSFVVTPVSSEVFGEIHKE